MAIVRYISVESRSVSTPGVFGSTVMMTIFPSLFIFLRKAISLTALFSSSRFWVRVDRESMIRTSCSYRAWDVVSLSMKSALATVFPIRG